jgi:ADP-dependent NAD(P)H-hydrate dehydratase / NAD(P)H-hydrate epimerase
LHRSISSQQQNQSIVTSVMTIFTPASVSPVDFFDRTSTIAIEQHLNGRLPRHTLMGMAGLNASRLAMSIAPHARSVWVACGPGNNGGDGLIAAIEIQTWMNSTGGTVWVTFLGQEESLPSDALWALGAARSAGVVFSRPPPEQQIDLGVDAMLGIGISSKSHPTANPIPSTMAALRSQCETLLCVDTPSDLDAFTGSPRWSNITPTNPAQRVHTLTFLTLKPGLLTGAGRDLAGTVWLDSLQPIPHVTPQGRWLPKATKWPIKPRWHTSHKGSHGDVWVLGGQTTEGGAHMLGAIVLAGRAAASAGAGRVTLLPVGAGQKDLPLDPVHPELMIDHRPPPQPGQSLQRGVWVVGCGGGMAICHWLPAVLASSSPVILDADALNQIACSQDLRQSLQARKKSGAISVITPHPLEAARLLDTDTGCVQSDRISAAQALSDKFNCICVLKGSGTVIAGPDSLPQINGTGNANLATAGTGDVLAGLIGGVMAGLDFSPHSVDQWHKALGSVLQAVHAHGLAAETWPINRAFTTAALPEAAGGLLRAVAK